MEITTLKVKIMIIIITIIKRSEDTLSHLWGNIKWSNICIMGIPDEEEKGPEKLYEDIMVENLPHTEKNSDIQI